MRRLQIAHVHFFFLPFFSSLLFSNHKKLDQVKSIVEGKYTPTINYKRLKLATAMYDEMAGYPNELSVRILSYFLRKTWKWLYPYGIHVNMESVAPVLEAAKRSLFLFFSNFFLIFF